MTDGVLIPSNRLKSPSQVSEEAGVPVTEIPRNLLIRRLEKSPHIHRHHLEAAVKVPGNEKLRHRISAPGQMRFCLETERRCFALINQPHSLSKDECRGSFCQERQGAASLTHV